MDNGEEGQWRKSELEIKCILEHVALKGYDFIIGWCGSESCVECNLVDVPVICEACSYNEKYDMRQPIEWPCTTERNRIIAESRRAQQARLDEIRQRRKIEPADWKR